MLTNTDRPFPRTLREAQDRAEARSESTGRANWFGPGENSFFGTRYETDIIEDGIFITSDSPHGIHDDASRGYAIRQAMPDGTVRSLSDLRAYATKEDAIDAVYIAGILRNDGRDALQTETEEN